MWESFSIFVKRDSRFVVNKFDDRDLKRRRREIDDNEMSRERWRRDDDDVERRELEEDNNSNNDFILIELLISIYVTILQYFRCKSAVLTKTWSKLVENS